jgi:hypothetical protein
VVGILSRTERECQAPNRQLCAELALSDFGCWYVALSPFAQGLGARIPLH